MEHGGGGCGFGGADGDSMHAGGEADKSDLHPNGHLPGAGKPSGDDGREKPQKPWAALGEKRGAGRPIKRPRNTDHAIRRRREKMNINWKVRFRNKTWVAAFLACVLAFLYQVLGMLGIVPPVSEDMVTQLIGAALNILVAVGVVVDPTTAGTGDSAQAMTYQEPKKG